MHRIAAFRLASAATALPTSHSGAHRIPASCAAGLRSEVAMRGVPLVARMQHPATRVVALRSWGRRDALHSQGHRSVPVTRSASGLGVAADDVRIVTHPS